ncbi:copper chaperone PCu(A)C [Leucobacter sp. GX24907]
MRRSTGAFVALLLALSAPLTLAGCASDSGPAPASEASDSTASDSSSETIEFRDGWVSARDEMSGVFGELVNHGSEDLELIGAESPAAGMVELHETVTSGAEPTMRALESPLEVPAGETLVLEPGGTHIMLMDLAEPLLAGDEVPVTLQFADGSELDISVLVKDTEGAQENYDGEDGGSAHGDHDDHAGH